MSTLLQWLSWRSRWSGSTSEGASLVGLLWKWYRWGPHLLERQFSLSRITDRVVPVISVLKGASWMLRGGHHFSSAVWAWRLILFLKHQENQVVFWWLPEWREIPCQIGAANRCGEEYWYIGLGLGNWSRKITGVEDLIDIIVTLRVGAEVRVTFKSVCIRIRTTQLYF